MKRIGVIVLILTALCPAGPAASEPVAPAAVQGSGELNLGARLASFFREHISAVDGDRCPSLPSCSAFSIQAFQKHGLIRGWLMTVDRLIHEGAEERAVSPLIYHQDRLKIHDPVANNDFWWFRPPKEEGLD